MDYLVVFSGGAIWMVCVFLFCTRHYAKKIGCPVSTLWAMPTFTDMKQRPDWAASCHKCYAWTFLSILPLGPVIVIYLAARGAL